MRVAFLTQDLQLSGGVGVIVEHAAQLAGRHGFDVSLVLTRRQAEPDWAFRGLEHLHVLDLDAAREQPPFDVVVSTWWETTEALFSLDAARHACFVQSLEDRFYEPWEPDRLHAALAQDLPVRYITEARWIAEALDGLHAGARPALYVRNGIAKDVFVPARAAPVRRRGPLRVLIEGSRAIAFKGVDDALAATAAMREPVHVTLVSPDGSGEGADEVIGPLSHAEMAQAYAQADVLLKLSRVEGMFGPPLEAFHAGTTCVVTPVTGHEEYVRHGWNGLVVDWEDTRGTARALDLLARDRRLLHLLRANALATARSWPSWEQQGAVMAAALRSVLRDPPPDPAPAARRLLADHALLAAHADRAVIDLDITSARLREVEDTNAYRYGVMVRTFVLRLVSPFRKVAAKLRRG